MADVHDDARVPRLLGELVEPPVVIDDLHREAGEAVGQDVARPHQREHVLDLRWAERDVHHHRQLAFLGRPACESERLEAVVADGRRPHPHLHADHQVTIALGEPPEEIDVEVRGVRALVVLTDEPDVRDVEERGDANACAVDDEVAETRAGSALPPSPRRSRS